MTEPDARPSNPYLPEEITFDLDQQVNAIILGNAPLLRHADRTREALARSHAREALTVTVVDLHHYLAEGAGTSWDDVMHGVAFSCALALGEWTEGYHLAWDESIEAGMSVQGFVMHAMQGRPDAAALTLDWASEEGPSAGLVAWFEQQGVGPEQAVVMPRVLALSAGVTGLMSMTMSRLRGDPDEHRGHGCTLDPDGEGAPDGTE